MVGSGSRNRQCASLVPEYLLSGGMHVAIERHALDHSHPSLLVSAVGLLKHPICSMFVKLFTRVNPHCSTLEHSASVVTPIRHCDLLCHPKGHGLRVHWISYC